MNAVYLEQCGTFPCFDLKITADLHIKYIYKCLNIIGVYASHKGLHDVLFVPSSPALLSCILSSSVYRPSIATSSW
jgi:hypothetical protein